MKTNNSLLGLCILLTSLFTISCTGKSEIVIELNASIHHDDFEYSVIDYKVTNQIGYGLDSLTANGIFYIVSFQVTNNAKRINHFWDNSIAYMTDKTGNIYENRKDAQKKLDNLSGFGWCENYTTPFQSSNSTKLVFDVPDNIENPCLMVRGKTLMGDFFNGGKFKRTKIKLF